MKRDREKDRERGRLEGIDRLREREKDKKRKTEKGEKK